MQIGGAAIGCDGNLLFFLVGLQLVALNIYYKEIRCIKLLFIKLLFVKYLIQGELLIRQR